MHNEKLQKIQATTLELIQQYRLDGWTFKWDRSKKRYGACHYRKRVISISIYLAHLNPYEETHNIILHEIAHAMAPGHNHDRVWQMVAIKIGCSGTRCYGDNVVNPPANYVLECTNCNHKVNRYRKPKRIGACFNCCKKYNFGKYDERFKLVLRYN